MTTTRAWLGIAVSIGGPSLFLLVLITVACVGLWRERRGYNGHHDDH